MLPNTLDHLVALIVECEFAQTEQHYESNSKPFTDDINNLRLFADIAGPHCGVAGASTSIAAASAATA